MTYVVLNYSNRYTVPGSCCSLSNPVNVRTGGRTGSTTQGPGDLVQRRFDWSHAQLAGCFAISILMKTEGQRNCHTT